MLDHYRGFRNFGRSGQEVVVLQLGPVYLAHFKPQWSRRLGTSSGRSRRRWSSSTWTWRTTCPSATRSTASSRRGRRLWMRSPGHSSPTWRRSLRGCRAWGSRSLGCWAQCPPTWRRRASWCSARRPRPPSRGPPRPPFHAQQRPRIRILWHQGAPKVRQGFRPHFLRRRQGVHRLRHRAQP